MKRLLLMLLVAIALALVLAACASDPAFREGERLLAEGKDAAGVAELEKSVAAHPGNAQYRTALVRAREALLRKGLLAAEAQARAGKLEETLAAYRELTLRYGDDARIVSAIGTLQVQLDNQTLLKAAADYLAKNEPEAARARLRAVLAREPGNPEAQHLLKQIEEKAGQPRGIDMPQLGASYRRPVSLEFRDAPLKQVFDALSRQSGLNFVFDKDVRVDQRATVFARDTAIADALDALLATSQLAKKILNGNTVLIYPNQPNKVKDYQEQVVKSFFLAHADAKNVMTLIRTMARIKDVYVDEKLNMVAVRDTPEVVRLAEKLVQMADRPDAEVMLEVEIMEVKRSRLQDLGVQWPSQFSALNLGTQTTTTVGTGVSVTTGAQVTNQLTLGSLKNIDANAIAINTAVINLKKDASDVNLLANPRIRVKSREKAKVHIGDKVPVITSNVTSTGVTSESVAYLDVGLKLDVEPQVGLEGDVTIKVGMEVSNIVREVKSATGTLTYQLGSRNANTVLRLRDGETQVLAGLISDEDRAGASKVPGLGDLPLIGRLFSSNRDELNKTEIILTITPHILRNIERPELADGEFFAGTESQTSDQPLRVRAARPALGQNASETEPALPVVMVPPLAQ
ncbi:MAG: secretin and TonB N-terminal domain-containing protein [Gallionellaceae bacterium]|nr:secretin and TonB N-terminal domain-containing protein [Gallionellaceae bacterium]